MTLRVSAEDALLLDVAGGARAAALAVASGPPQWDRVLEAARWHRLGQLLWEHQRRPGAVQAPADVEHQLREEVRATTARNLVLQFERDRVVTALHEVGIPVLLLKGAALLETVYDHIGLRPMVDLDLLVPVASLQRAHELLEHELGFTVGGARLGRDDAARIASSHHHFPLLRRGGAVMVELHHRVIVDRPAYDAAPLWERAVAADGPSPYLLPDPNDLLLHVATHFAFDRINRDESSLGQLADIVRVVRRYPIDWPAVVRRARRYEVADRLFLALASANLVFDAVAPTDVVADLAPAGYTLRRGERFVRQRVLAAGSAFPLEQLSYGPRRVFLHTGGLERYVRPTDVAVPSRARLHARRWAALSRRVAQGVSRPVELVRDIQLSRWIVSLRS